MSECVCVCVCVCVCECVCVCVCVSVYQQVLRFDVSVYDVHSVQVSQRSGQVEQHGAGVSLCVLRGGSDGIKQITALQKTHNTVTHYLHWDCCVSV